MSAARCMARRFLFIRRSGRTAQIRQKNESEDEFKKEKKKNARFKMICTPQYWTPSIGGTYHAARRFLGFSLTFFPSKCCAAAPILSSKSWSTPGNAFAVVDALCHHNTEAGLTGIQISVTNLSVSLVMPQSMSVTSREKPPICILCLSI